MRMKKIAGVCAGFAEYLEIDVTVMRIIFLALAILPPAIGGIAYVIGWIAMPRDDQAGPV
jgi:phage shock protein C